MRSTAGNGPSPKGTVSVPARCAGPCSLSNSTSLIMYGKGGTGSCGRADDTGLFAGERISLRGRDVPPCFQDPVRLVPSLDRIPEYLAFKFFMLKETRLPSCATDVTGKSEAFWLGLSSVAVQSPGVPVICKINGIDGPREGESSPRQFPAIDSAEIARDDWAGASVGVIVPADAASSKTVMSIRGTSSDRKL